MSFSSAKLPSPPEKARLAHSRDVAVETTGFQRAPYRDAKNSKKRSRSLDSHHILPKSAELPKDPILAHFQKEYERNEEASCVFLLWGSQNSGNFTTWAVDIPTTDTKSEDEIFALLAKQYATELGFLRRFLSFRRFSELKPVTFQPFRRSSKKFSVFMKPFDLAKYHKEYTEKREETHTRAESIRISNMSEDPMACYPDKSGDFHHDHNYCPYNRPAEPGEVCPFEEWHKWNNRIRGIENAPNLSCYFRNPAGARFQDISGFIRREFIHYYESIRFPHAQFGAQNKYSELHGLYVETAWDPSKCLYVFLGILLCVVAGGKLFWASWEITFGAGSFIVALPMLALAMFSYREV